MDPLSIAAGVLAVTAAEQTRRALDRVRTALKTIPGRLSALNNQVADLEVLLRQIVSLMASRDQHPELATAEAHNQIRDVARRASGSLRELRDLSAQIEKSGNSQSRIGSIQRARTWHGYLARLHEIQDGLTVMRLRLDLVAVAGLPNDQAMPQQEMLEHLFEHIDRRIESVNMVVREQTQELERSQTALLTRRSSSASMDHQSPGIRLVVAGRTNACRAQCKCACYRTQKLATPSFLSQVLGQLFVEHVGIPAISTKCDTSTCVKVQASQVYQANLGPSFQLRTLRRVPDSAAAVNFAMNGNIPGLQELFRRGAASPQDVSDTRGYSLIRWALYSRQYKTVRFLHAAGADADYRPKALHDNSTSNKAADAIMMGGLAYEVVDDVACIANQNWVEEQNFPLLHRIVLGLHGKDLEEALSEDPTVVNREDAMGRTALNRAAARGDDRSVAALLSYGADPNILDCQHSGPVSYAAEKNHTVCVRILLEAGAQPDPVITGGQRSLLDFGADVDASGVDGRTALMHAARTDNVSFALLFLEHNTNINAISTAGQTPLTTAIVNNSHRILKLLLSRWADYSACPRLRGPHLLETAAQFANHETLSILCSTNHVRLRYDKNYHAGDFDKVLRQRHDRDEKLDCAFADFMFIVREEFSDVSDEKSTSGDEFFDSAEHLLD
ncbi:ankyrin repeat-containing domain protein [Staphylotrichum tortipilum]|uniref:Ankyrin repeat-containing domain protein n=1 Tax=Staphylotrichum tortipilum TaxID=2831512 RepID=A0AAN6MGL2_9PEZI|nr:ankyrin repeat-containing domain protein [Staphylotrichum longicolle]